MTSRTNEEWRAVVERARRCLDGASPNLVDDAKYFATLALEYHERCDRDAFDEVEARTSPE